MFFRRLLKNDNKREKAKSQKNVKSNLPNYLQNNTSTKSKSHSVVDSAHEILEQPNHEIQDSHQSNENVSDEDEEIVWCNDINQPISANQIHTNFITKHADEDLLFRSEFEKIPRYVATKGVKFNYAKQAENAAKNRYKNVVTSDHARVKLKVLNDDPFSDYINATYIDGYDYKKKFIAAQGPKENTVNDFWRMIWEQNTHVIVMITQLHETARKKCELYWPEDDQTVTYGQVSVTLTKTIDHGTFVCRQLSVHHQSAVDKRLVHQYQFLVWPDHGVPKSTSDIFRFRERTLEAQPQDVGPILVHCSAGVGRTGTYIGLDYLLQELYGTGKIDPLALIFNFRLRRSEMVQSLEQYVLLHKLIDEWRTIGRTEITKRNFSHKFEQLIRYIIKPRDHQPYTINMISVTGV